ncbi:MAG: family 43 glycosylhydrolase [Tepidisphaeraceae bacterium]
MRQTNSSRFKRRYRCAATALAVLTTSAGTRLAQLTGVTGAHDPSMLIKAGSTYYYFATGQGIAARTSPDRVNWSAGASVFSTPPAWTIQTVSGFTGNFWAPDIAFFNNQYYLYYSASSWGTIDSAIGVATSPSLSSPVWTDQGKVVQSDAVGYTSPTTDTTAYNAIDPSILVDTDGKVWMSFGSYSSGILVTQINPTTGKRLNTSTLSATLLANNAAGGGWGSSIEGSALVKHGSFYYLFVNYGGCCAGIDSTYNIRVGRSTSPTGPFLDRNGVNMTAGGGTIFLDDDGKMTGPGHFSYYTEGGQDYFGYHYYNGDANGAPTYGLRSLYWTSDNWPSYAAVNPNWLGTNTANWSAGANWSLAVAPNGVGQIANFGANSFNRYAIAIDGSAKTVSTINFSSTASYTIGVTNGLGLTLDAQAGDYATINVSAGNHTVAAPLTAVDALGVNVTPVDSTLTISGAVTAPSFTKYGRGGLALSGTNAYSGTMLIRAGTVDVTGSVNTTQYTSVGANVGEIGAIILRGNGSFTASADFNVGDTGDAFTAATGTLELRDSAILTVGAAGAFVVGAGFFANTQAIGTANQTGGTLTANGNFDGAFIIGGRTSALAIGTYNLGGGSINANTNVRVGGYGTGTMNQAGGTFNTASYISIGRFAGSTGTWSLSGGTLNQTASARQLIVGESGSGMFTVSSTGQAVLKGPLQLGRNAGSSGVVNLNGGVITAPAVTRGSGSATFNFNGGKLSPSTTTTTFMQGLTIANVKAGGAVVDTNGFDVTIAQPLLHDTALGATTDGGLIKAGSGALTLSGSNTYTGSTIISGGTLVIGNSARTPIFSGGGGDLRGGRLVFNYTGGTTPALQVQSALATGFGQAPQFSSGAIRSTTLTASQTIGWIDDGTSLVTVAATLPGDTNLDLTVGFADLLVLAAHYGTPSNWAGGDVNYDGTVNFTDLLALAASYGQSMPAAVVESAWASAALTVPEPDVWSGLMLVALRRSRR